jgi:hypothetical protein
MRRWTTSSSFPTKSPGRFDNISGKECRIIEAEYVGLYKL